MDLGVQSQETFETNEIEDIDAQGYLVINNGYDAERDQTDNVDMDFGFENEATNDVIGKVFDTPNDAYSFYNHYALLHGFGIRIFSTYKNTTTNEQYRKKFVCNKQGFKDLKRDNCKDTNKRRRELRTGCEAFLRISKDKDDKWLVDKFNDSHNHEVTLTPSKAMKHRSHAKFHRSVACKSLMLELGQSGLKPCQIKKVVNTMKSPNENDVTSKQCADVLADQRKQYRAVEARRAAEEDQDFKTMNSKPVLSSVSLLEAKAGSRYTRKLFDVFKKEWTEATFNLSHERICKNLEEIIYKADEPMQEKEDEV
ncbi:hypothetical protein QVD17_31674 [Tagetes erecta]|uniref:FAR1 domain-containing protein n=1 Tax=Tagetes erecta TaxID=13708 RepID=A0AAD8K7G0_TARER|nr:hypothetical protein QVD17_31674 [Tagetes erecta]